MVRDEDVRSSLRHQFDRAVIADALPRDLLYTYSQGYSVDRHENPHCRGDEIERVCAEAAAGVK